MKKVFLSILVAAFFATFVIACGNQTEESDDVDSTATEQAEEIEGMEEEIEELANDSAEVVMEEEVVEEVTE